METPLDIQQKTEGTKVMRRGTTTRQLPGLQTFSRGEKLLLAGALAAESMLAGLSLIHGPAWLSFSSAAIALTVLSLLIGEAADHISERSTPFIAACLQATLGNIPELMISLFALRSGLTTLVQYGMIGSVIGTSVLVLGSALLLGGWHHRRLLF